jgi:hypothetical protein
MPELCDTKLIINLMGVEQINFIKWIYCWSESSVKIIKDNKNDDIFSEAYTSDGGLFLLAIMGNGWLW